MLERLVWFITALAILVLAFFFIAAAIVFGAVLAAVLLARIWWIRRKMTKAAERQIITTEYTVIERESQVQHRLPDDAEQPLRSERQSRGGPGP